MFSPLTSLFSLLLVATAGLLFRIQGRPAEEQAGESAAVERERQFLQHQYRRRLQVTGMLGAIGVAMFVGQFLDHWPLVNMFFWTGVLVLVCWMLILAVGDLLVTKQHYGIIQRDDLLAEMQYHAQLGRDQEGDDPAEEGAAGN